MVMVMVMVWYNEAQRKRDCRRGGGGQFSEPANDDDDVASFSKNSKTRVSTSCLTAATGRMFPIPGLNKRGREEKRKNKLPLSSSVIAIVQ